MFQDDPIIELTADQASQPIEVASTPSPSSDQDLLTTIKEQADVLWDKELFSVNDTSIVVNQLVIALIVLIVGYICAKIISKRVGSTVLPRLKVEPGPANAIQSILHYLLLTIAVFLALNIAGVPLTVFTIFGGALALGIGFGSQNVVNNFISGLILLIERPIRVNDLVTVQNETGTVFNIGARATKIVSYDGTTFIVPNSILLENSVINWNLPTRKLRTIIKVGVAYGTDTGLVKSVLEELLEDHIRVLESPDNRVLFMDFGDSSLNFEVHFWISPRSTLDRRQIESDLRFKIDALFREHNITIPFPQRDINFNGDHPFMVSVKNSE
tara:strand:- start:1867 stop:2850 length:984 start_codon:yes stop_codon:yes gene_type:complete